MSFVIKLMSETDEKPSFGRVFAALIIVAAIGWITFLVLKNGQMPELAGVSLWMTGGVAASYGANKVATAIENR